MCFVGALVYWAGNTRWNNLVAAAIVLRIQALCGLIFVYCDFVGNLLHIVLDCGIDEHYRDVFE